MPLFYEILKALKSCGPDDLYLAGSTLKTIFCFCFSHQIRFAPRLGFFVVVVVLFCFWGGREEEENNF